MELHIIECGKDVRKYYIGNDVKKITVSDGYNCKFRSKDQIEKEMKEFNKCIIRCMTGQLTITVNSDGRTKVINEGIINSNCSGLLIIK